MNNPVAVAVEDVLPDSHAVFRFQGIPEGREVGRRVRDVFEKSMQLFRSLASPVMLIEEIPGPDFAVMFRANDLNDDASPVPEIVRRADRLALVAVTIGEPVCAAVREHFASNEYPDAIMLDSIAALAADRTINAAEVTTCERWFPGKDRRHAVVLSYSPGYCGWHLSSQKQLFEKLHPERIGISLNDNFLMSPIKSVTGVLAGGDPSVHVFSPGYGFCADCRTKSCYERLDQLQ